MVQQHNTSRLTIDKLKGQFFADPDEARKVADYGRRRYKVFAMDFDTRATSLEPEKESWDEKVKQLHRQNRERLREGLKLEYGEHGIDRKVADFGAMGIKPITMLAYHNMMFEQVRASFTMGAYYPALTSACALGERILNHLVLDLREDYRATPEYKKVHRKSSFDDWRLCVDVLEAWGVLLPKMGREFLALSKLRHRSIHFNPETYRSLREDALEAIGHIAKITGTQFTGFGGDPWFIRGTKGHCFIKRECESLPFIRKYYLPRCPLVGVSFGMALRANGQWLHLDKSDYGDGELSDEEFKDAYNNRDPESVLSIPADHPLLKG